MMIKKSAIRFFLKLAFVFCFLYDIEFLFLPKLTTARFAVAGLLFCCCFYKNIHISKKMVSFLAFLFLIIGFSILQFIYSRDFTQPSRLLWFTFYGIVVPYIFAKFLVDTREFLWLILICTFIQGIITLNSFFVPGFKQLIMSYVFIGGNQIELSIFRAIGLASISGAAFSVIQSCGVFAGLLLMKKIDKRRYRVIAFFLTFFVLLSTLVIGRTGLINSLLAFAIFFISELSVKNVFKYALVVCLLLQVNYLSIISRFTNNIPGFNMDYFFEWTGEAFRFTNNHTADVIRDMPIPPLTLNTWIGTGEVVDKKLGINSSGHDSGYIQTYYSLGLILSIIFYTGYLLFLVNEVHRAKKWQLLLPVLLMFIIEIKEPFIFKYMLPFFVLTLILIERKDRMLQSADAI